MSFLIHDKLLIAFGDESCKFLTQLAMVGYWLTMAATARETATTSVSRKQKPRKLWASMRCHANKSIFKLSLPASIGGGSKGRSLLDSQFSTNNTQQTISIVLCSDHRQSQHVNCQKKKRRRTLPKGKKVSRPKHRPARTHALPQYVLSLVCRSVSLSVCL